MSEVYIRIIQVLELYNILISSELKQASPRLLRQAVHPEGASDLIKSVRMDAKGLIANGNKIRGEVADEG